MTSEATSSLIAEREMLYFFRLDGCPACAAALPELYRFMAKHPTITVLILNAAGPYPASLGVKLKSTPTYVFRHQDTEAIRGEAMKATEIEKWIRANGGSL